MSPQAFELLAHRLCPEPFGYCPRVSSILILCLLHPWTLGEKIDAMLWENRRMMRQWRPSTEASVAWWELLVLEIWVLDLVVLRGQRKSVLEVLRMLFSLLVGLSYRIERGFGQGRQFIPPLAFEH